MSRRCAATLAAVALLAAGGARSARAQDAAPPAGQIEAVAAVEELESIDVGTLVAPVALYPDPLLGLVLQASLQPLQIVQAERFLAKRKSDPTLTPDTAWDSSILGLLNYPSLVQSMSEYLEWTEALGDAVAADLKGVQAAVQDIRWSSRAAGILKSDDRQKVIADGDTIRIMPADPKTISIPRYDPVALLAAIEPVAEGDMVEAEVTEVAVQQAAAPAAAAAPVAAAPAEPMAAAPAAVAVAPVAYAPVGYAPVAAVPMAYSEPSSSFWDVAAPFAGGAIVGGILGYALSGDDDDDYHGGGYGGGYNSGNTINNNVNNNINIEDSVVGGGGGKYDRDKVERELRDRHDKGQGNRPDRGRPVQTGGVAPSKRPAATTRDTAKVGGKARPSGTGKAMQLPGAAPGAKVPAKSKVNPATGRPASGAANKPKPANKQVANARPVTAPAAKGPAAKAPAARAPAVAKPQPAKAKLAGGAGMTAGLGAPRQQVQREANRGAQSRQVAKPAARAPAAPKPAQRGGGMSSPNRGGNVKQDANRGKQSRGGGGGGGGRGGGGGGKKGRGR